MTRPLAAAAVALVLLVAGCGDDDDGSAAGAAGVVVSDAWARSTPPGVDVGVVYVTVTSATGDRLVRAEVAPSVADHVEMHRTLESDGMTSMEPVDSLAVPAGGELVLAPLGDHLMLVGLAAPLTSGTSFEVTLHFATAGDQVVEVEVRDDAP